MIGFELKIGEVTIREERRGRINGSSVFAFPLIQNGELVDIAYYDDGYQYRTSTRQEAGHGPRTLNILRFTCTGFLSTFGIFIATYGVVGFARPGSRGS